MFKNYPFNLCHFSEIWKTKFPHTPLTGGPHSPEPSPSAAPEPRRACQASARPRGCSSAPSLLPAPPQPALSPRVLALIFTSPLHSPSFSLLLQAQSELPARAPNVGPPRLQASRPFRRSPVTADPVTARPTSPGRFPLKIFWESFPKEPRTSRLSRPRPNLPPPPPRPSLLLRPSPAQFLPT